MTEGSPEDTLFEAAFYDAGVGAGLLAAEQGRFLQVNDALCGLLGYAREALLELALDPLVHADDRVQSQALCKQLLDGSAERGTLELRLLHRDASSVFALLSLAVSRRSAGAPVLVMQTQEVGTRRTAEAEARMLFEQSLDLLAVASTDGRFTHVSPAWQSTLELSAEELTSRPFMEFVHPDDHEATRGAFEELIAGRSVRGFRNRYRHQNGSYRWLQWNTKPYADGQLFCVARDVSAEVQAEQDLHLRERALAAIGTGIMITDATQPELPILYINPAFTRITGYDAEDVRGQSCRCLLGDDPEQPGVDELKAALSEGREHRVVLRNYKKSGEMFLSQLSVAPVSDAAGMTTHFVGALEDVTERIELEEEIRQASLVDELTGLYNRRGFFLLGEQTLRAARRHERSHLLCFVDLDGLKEINDELGHVEGDRALIDAAELLRRVFRQSDIVARIGGDEFVTLAEGDHAAEASLRQRIGDELDRHNDSAERLYRLGFSLGIAVFTPRKPQTLGELLQQADRQMYEHKRSGRRSVPAQSA